MNAKDNIEIEQVVIGGAMSLGGRKKKNVSRHHHHKERIGNKEHKIPRETGSSPIGLELGCFSSFPLLLRLLFRL